MADEEVAAVGQQLGELAVEEEELTLDLGKKKKKKSKKVTIRLREPRACMHPLLRRCERARACADCGADRLHWSRMRGSPPFVLPHFWRHWPHRQVDEAAAGGEGEEGAGPAPAEEDEDMDLSLDLSKKKKKKKKVRRTGPERGQGGEGLRASWQTQHMRSAADRLVISASGSLAAEAAGGVMAEAAPPPCRARLWEGEGRDAAGAGWQFKEQSGKWTAGAARRSTRSN
jgi:hypothetical protein